MRRTTISLAAVSIALSACHEDPGPCRPGDATFSTLRGSVAIQGEAAMPFDVAAAPNVGPCTVSSRSSGDRNADVAVRTTIDLSCQSGDQHLSITFEVDDVRFLGAGDHALVTDDYGLRISYRPNAASPECYTYLPDTAYQLAVREAVGDFAMYPALVTDDFHRAIGVELSLALHGRSAKQYTNGVVSSCSLDFAGTIAMSAVLDAADFQARATDSCILE